MRGENAWRPKAAASFNRYTPTCVGKTLEERLVEYTMEVHPHMRGENYLL